MTKFNTDTMDFRERMDRFASRGTIWGGKGRMAYKALVAEVNKLREEAFAEGMKVALDQVAATNTNELLKLRVNGFANLVNGHKEPQK